MLDWRGTNPYTLLESLDTLTTWAVDKFKDVRNKNIDPPTFEGHPLTEKELKVIR
jgi:insulysin